MLGVTTLVNLVLTSSAGRYFRDYGDSTESSQSDLWMRSVTNALASRIIADHNRMVDPERAYTAGLLQNIGSLVLDRFMHNGRQQVFAVAQAGYSLLDAEKHALGLHHAEIGARLATRWGLPDVLTDTIRFHHAPEKATVDPLLTATVHLAETVATARIAGDNMPGFAYEVHDAALQLTGMKPEDFDVVDMGLQGELERAEALFEI
jgi:HD-like signal output (HDOD) protein